MRARDCRHPRGHQFHPISGWCTRMCGVREDGRVITRDGQVILNGPDHTEEQLNIFRQRATENA